MSLLIPATLIRTLDNGLAIAPKNGYNLEGDMIIALTELQQGVVEDTIALQENLQRQLTQLPYSSEGYDRSDNMLDHVHLFYRFHQEDRQYSVAGSMLLHTLEGTIEIPLFLIENIYPS